MGNSNMKLRSRNSEAKTEAVQLVESAIETYPVVIFSKSYCPYCSSAKRDIATAGQDVANFKPPKVFELNTMGDLGAQVQSYLAQKTGRRTVPNVFIGGKTVGGGDDIAGYARRNVLKQMLTHGADVINERKEADIRKLVEDTIENNAVVVFSKTYCPYCNRAKALLANVGSTLDGYLGANVLELDEREDGEAIQEYLYKKTRQSSVPNIFIGGNHIGGSDDLAGMHDRNELAPAISKALSGEDTGSNPDTEVAAAEEAVSEASTPKNFVENAIAKNAVVIFSKSYCPYCMRAKALISKTGESIPEFKPATVYELDEMEDGSAIQQYLLEKTGQRTVPNIFIGGQHIGGSDSVSELSASGTLASTIEEAQKAIPSDVTNAQASTETPPTKEIVFGAGCFWGVELAFQRIVGVVKTEVGYSNGKLNVVTYDSICSGLTGAAEVVRVTYNPAIVSLTDLLKAWESRHDPTSLNKQGNDVGTQYRSSVYFNDEEQNAEIRKYMDEASTRLSKPIVSEIAQVNNYCTAEEYHQKYLEKKGQSAAKGDTTKIRCYG